MILSAILLFMRAAIMGGVLAVVGMRHQRSYLKPGLGHASVALLAFILLGIGIFRGPTNMLYNSAALLFALALSGGLVLCLPCMRVTSHSPWRWSVFMR